MGFYTTSRTFIFTRLYIALKTLSPLQAHSQTPTMPNIPPQEIGDDVDNHLVYSASNPQGCPCGWYIYYSSVCTHEFTQYKLVCGRSEGSGFCKSKSPAPKNIVSGTQVSAPCRLCVAAATPAVPRARTTRPQRPAAAVPTPPKRQSIRSRRKSPWLRRSAGRIRSGIVVGRKPVPRTVIRPQLEPEVRHTI